MLGERPIRGVNVGTMQDGFYPQVLCREDIRLIVPATEEQVSGMVHRGGLKPEARRIELADLREQFRSDKNRVQRAGLRILARMPLHWASKPLPSRSLSCTLMSEPGWCSTVRR